MSEKTGIEWTDATWNPVRGCSRVSEGCRNCYAEAVAARFSGPGLPYEGLAADGKWTGKVRLIPEHLADPLRWKKPRKIFVNSMSDLFHDGLKDEEIAAVFGVMVSAPQHTFQVLTKRPRRMFEWVRWASKQSVAVFLEAAEDLGAKLPNFSCGLWPEPKNIWLGVSVEDQKTADERIPLLLQTPAAVRFVSAEPLLGPVNLLGYLMEGPDPGHCLNCGDGHGFERCPNYGGVVPIRTAVSGATCTSFKRDHACGLGWVIVGGESGPKARPMHVSWARKIVEACGGAGVACFVKQMGEHLVGSTNLKDADGAPLARWDEEKKSFIDGEVRIRLKDRKGGDPAEWAQDLRVRQFPEVRKC